LQLSSPGFTHIYAALVAIINTKLPENGELVLKRVVHGFKRAYKVCVDHYIWTFLFVSTTL